MVSKPRSRDAQAAVLGGAIVLGFATLAPGCESIVGIKDTVSSEGADTGGTTGADRGTIGGGVTGGTATTGLTTGSATTAGLGSTGAATSAGSSITGGTTGALATTTGGSSTTGGSVTGATTGGRASTSSTGTTNSDGGSGGRGTTGGVVVCPGCEVKVQYENGLSAAMSGTIQGQLLIVSTGTATVPFSEVTVRYWLNDARASDLVFECDYWTHDKTTITAHVVTGGTQSAVELSFSDMAGTVDTATAISNAFSFRIHHPLYDAMDQTDDYSFDPTAMSFTDAEHITAYIGGRLVWGTEPK